MARKDREEEIGRVAQQAMRAHLSDAHALQALGAAGHLSITEADLVGADNLEVIFIGAAGFDRIDVRAATDRGILVVNAPGGNAVGVAEHALALMLDLSHRVSFADGYAHRNLQQVSRVELRASGPRLSVLEGKTVGLVGFGAIAREVAKRAGAFGMNIIAVDPFADSGIAAGLGVELVDELSNVLGRADFVSLHLPLTPATSGYIAEAEIAQMKSEAILINTARGGIVDTDALVQALQEDLIAGAGLDVTEPEPLPHNHALFSLGNVVLTPHVGGASAEMLQRSAEVAADLALRILDGEDNVPVVNPEALKKFRTRFG